jgi:hypothetical protein
MKGGEVCGREGGGGGGADEIEIKNVGREASGDGLLVISLASGPAPGRPRR